MWKNINLEQCLAYVNSHANTGGQGRPGAHPAVTISRMCGAGGRTVASKVADDLQPHAPPGRYWTIFDKNLIQKVLEDHHLSRRIAEFMPEAHQSLLAETLGKMRGQHPSTATLVQQTAETIWHLAEGGHVIIVGRAGNLITAKLDNVFHVRLVGSLESRTARIEEVYELSRTDAQEFIRVQDTAKRQYMKDYFGRDIDDPLLYHLVINTDDISYENAAKLIGDAVIHRFKLPAGPELAAR
jgi:cytidylate kinase